jgi:hypothetical protein
VCCINRRVNSDEGQTPEEVAQVIINLIINRQHSRTLSGTLLTALTKLMIV